MTVTSVYALLFALFLLGLLLYILYHQSGRMFYFLFIFGVFASSLLFSDFTRPMEECCSAQSFPFGLPLLYLIGPSYLLYKNGYRYHPGWMWLHYSPAILIFLNLVISALFQPDFFMESITKHTLGEGTNITGSAWLTDKAILILYPIHALIYLLSHLRIQAQEGAPLLTKDDLVTYVMIINIPVIILLISVFNGFLDVRPTTLTAIQVFVLSSVPILIIDIINGYQQVEQKTRVNAVLKTIDMAHISLFLGGQIFPKSDFTSPGFSKEQLLVVSDIPESDWDEYLNRKSLTFNGLKRWVRVQISKKLILDGYLDKYSVEALSQDVGYRSRTSFYSAFKEIEGMSFMEFRERNKK